MLYRRFTSMVLLLILTMGGGLLSTATPNVTIISPRDGTVSHTKSVNITGTASGSEASWVQTTTSDFNAGTLDNISSDAIGTLSLDLALYDDFNDNDLDNAKWSDTFATSEMNLSEQNGVLEFNGTCISDCRAWARSSETFSGQMSADLRFFQGTGSVYNTIFGPYQNDNYNAYIGVMRDPSSFGPGDKVVIGYVNGGVRTNTAISAWAGGFHHFGVSWNGTAVQFYLDDILQAVRTVSLVNSKIGISAYAQNNGDAVDARWDTAIGDYARIGNFTSSVFDTRSVDPVLKNVSWISDMPSGTGITVQVRSGNDFNMTSPTAWATIGNGQINDLPAVRRYLQYKVSLTSTFGLNTPLFQDIAIGYVKPIRSVTVSIDGKASWQPATGLEQWHIMVTLPENATQIWVNATDVAGDSRLTSVTVNVDTTPPGGAVLINNGMELTDTPAVTLSLNTTGLPDMTEMLVSNEADFEDARWISFQSELAWNLLPGNGERFVFAKFRDPAMHESSVYNDSIFLDTISPLVNVTVNGGETYTRSPTVTLSLTISENHQIDSMLLSEGPYFIETTQGAFSPSVEYNFLPGDGQKTLYAKVRDAAGNTGPINISTIILDSIPPFSYVNPLTSETDNPNFTVSWNGIDAFSGVEWFDIQYRDGTGPWTGWLNHTGLTSAVFHGKNLHTYYFRARAQDIAGNLESFPDGPQASIFVRMPVVIPQSPHQPAKTLTTHPEYIPAAVAAISIGIVCFLFVGGTEVGKYKLALFLSPLYTRLKKDELLDNEIRGIIRGYIQADPGVHFNELLRQLKLATGTLVYHLTALEREGIIKSRRDGGLRRFYPAEMRLSETHVRLNRFQTVILKIVQEHPGISQRNIARMLELPHVITHRHIKQMAGMGVLVIHRAGIATKCYPAPEWKDRPPGSTSQEKDKADVKR